MIDELLFNLDKNRISGLVMVDYCKAFDMIDHDLLQQKSKAYDIENCSLRWFQSYLSNRKQLVSLCGIESTELIMNHGVPHGSILGPLMFIIFINDLPLYVSSSIHLCADDTTVVASADYNSIPDLESSLNKSVAEIAQWATINKLPLNEDKTKVLAVTGKRFGVKIDYPLNVTVNGNPLKNVTNAKLLGLNIDEKLSFEIHVDELCKKLSKRIAVLRKIRSYLSLRQRKMFYNSMIRSVMNYVNVIYQVPKPG